MQEQFHWERQPKAEALVLKALESCCEASDFVAELKEQLQRRASTFLMDWLDHVIVERALFGEKELEEAGFVSEEPSVFHHPGAQLPRVVLGEKGALALSVESIGDFLMVRGLEREIEGALFGGYRRCRVTPELYVVERRGALTLTPTEEGKEHAERYLSALERWQARGREDENVERAMQRALKLAEELAEEMGRDMAAWIVLEGERRYWQAKNRAGQLQRARQESLGMGWANHDHHTFRSSREYFTELVKLFETLGFDCRERFYAGEEAGWGAQVMENSRCGLVLFLDVDLDPHEVAVDFAHQKLPELEQLGTIGLWCGLHGDSILGAGMHHLEAQFFFEELREDLDQLGIGMMAPFSDFPYLKQAFTKGELWPVREHRLQRLLLGGKISEQEAERFRREGAIGSHLENLQRREGYKGFNKKNVSFIIKKTDPRKSSI